jgi:hypothetical protein
MRPAARGFSNKIFVMKMPVFLTALLLLSGIAAPVFGLGDPPSFDKLAKPLDIPIPKGAQHMVIDKGDKDAKGIFTYFPYPPLPSGRPTLPAGFSGIYRLEVSPEGNVTAITILRTMGKALDYHVMKTFIKWKAKPGGLRVVDVPWTLVYSGVGVRSIH